MGLAVLRRDDQFGQHLARLASSRPQPKVFSRLRIPIGHPSLGVDRNERIERRFNDLAGLFLALPERFGRNLLLRVTSRNTTTPPLICPVRHQSAACH